MSISLSNLHRQLDRHATVTLKKIEKISEIMQARRKPWSDKLMRRSVGCHIVFLLTKQSSIGIFVTYFGRSKAVIPAKAKEPANRDIHFYSWSNL